MAAALADIDIVKAVGLIATVIGIFWAYDALKIDIHIVEEKNPDNEFASNSYFIVKNNSKFKVLNLYFERVDITIKYKDQPPWILDDTFSTDIFELSKDESIKISAIPIHHSGNAATPESCIYILSARFNADYLIVKGRRRYKSWTVELKMPLNSRFQWNAAPARRIC